MLRVTLTGKHLVQRVNFCFAKVINFLSEGYQNVCPGSGVAFGYTSCFMPTDKDLQVSENLIRAVQ